MGENEREKEKKEKGEGKKKNETNVVFVVYCYGSFVAIQSNGGKSKTTDREKKLQELKETEKKREKKHRKG